MTKNEMTARKELKCMNYGEIKNFDTANGIGVRVSLFVSGCTNHCEHCFQPETWDFSHGRQFTEETQEMLLQMLKPAYIHGFTLLGGEPFEPENQRGILPFLQKVKRELPGKTVWAYTGFVLEDLVKKGTHANCEVTEEVLSFIDVLIDGRFVEEKKNLSLQFRGSENQRIIDLCKTRSTGQLTMWEDPAGTAEGK